MTWVKIDDRLPRHPKMIGLNVNAKWAFIETLCYCAEYLTDGSFPRGLIGGRELAALVHAGLRQLRAEQP